MDPAEPSAGTPKESLQDAFKGFLDRKRKERVEVKKRAAGNAKSQEEKDALRARFLETALSYVGTPYSRKEHPEGSALRDHPLELDCCALVRRALDDLSDEFGFKPLRYNQCYQFDTLPVRYELPTQMQPGDLVFYEGAYFNKGSRPQKHNITHVEVYIGGPETPEKCVGSRFRSGVVSIFDSFRFESAKWGLIRHHFCSIDTWLDGVCRSHCPIHNWDGRNLPSTKGSIFEPLEEADLVEQAEYDQS